MTKYARIYSSRSKESNITNITNELNTTKKLAIKLVLQVFSRILIYVALQFDFVKSRGTFQAFPSVSFNLYNLCKYVQLPFDSNKQHERKILLILKSYEKHKFCIETF